MSPVYSVAMASVAQLALVMSASAYAQTNPPGAATLAREEEDIEDIVVTATRQGAQSLQSVPLAIQAFSGDQLERQQISNTNDLFEAIPGGSLAQEIGSTIRTYTLRGVGATSGIGDSPIGYYVDDVPFTLVNFPLAPPLRFVDMERIEVLRGPHGTLYGQGSAGGTIIYHTRDPNLDQLEFRGEASVGTTKGAGALNYGASAAVSAPLIPGKLAIRVSGGYDKRAGYADVFSGLPTGAPLKKNANNIYSEDIRAVMLWKPVDALSLRAQVFHFEPHQDYLQALNSLEPPQLWNNGTVDSGEEANFDLYSLSAEYDAGFAVLRSSTSYLDGELSYLIGRSFGPFLGNGSLFNGYDLYSFAQELQLRSAGEGPFNWVLGGFYQQAKSTFSFDAQLSVLSVAGSTATKTKNYSAFGEVSYELLGGKLVPLFGLRYYKDNRSFVAEAPDFLGGSASGRNKPDKITWRANLSFIPSDNFTAFVTAGTGFRSGITQTPLQVFALNLDNIPGSTALAPDTLTNYEAGMKVRLAGGAVQVGLNVYRINYKDMQLGLVAPTTGIAAFTSAGDAKSTGVDLELRWRTPLKGLNVGAVANWNDSKFKDIVPAVSAALPTISPGERMINTSKYNYRLDADYETPLTDDLRLFVAGSASRSGSRIMVDGFKTPAFSLYDATIGIRNDRWEIALFGENLADERGPSYALSGNLGQPLALFNGPYPRTIGIRVRANLD